MMAMMAFACALLLQQPIGAKSRDEAEKDRWYKRSRYARRSS